MLKEKGKSRETLSDDEEAVFGEVRDLTGKQGWQFLGDFFVGGCDQRYEIRLKEGNLYKVFNTKRPYPDAFDAGGKIIDPGTVGAGRKHA